ncbi:MAG TPA: FliH/SctL family protein [Candidatus Hydrogenedentes bacterium]|nr:FliH/SctL family protein [Candidatus Hydrogenedentota bacterium]HOV60491.1 FliH/SctL family protein [Candidatus Hydrogenedentota bacterium]
MAASKGSRIYKRHAPSWRSMIPITRDALPELQEVHPAPADNPETAEAVQPEIDMEALRQQVLEEANREAERVLEQAREEGYRQGLEEGRAEFARKVEGVLELYEGLAEELRQKREAFLDSLEPQVLALAKLIAQRVIDREISLDNRLVALTIRRALAEVSDRQKIRVTVNPEDLAVTRELVPELRLEFPGIETVEVETSDQVGRGGCVVESELMRVDARMETLLARVLEALSE